MQISHCSGAFATGVLSSYFHPRLVMYLLNVYSIFKVREVFAITNQLGNFFRFERTKFGFFQKNFSDRLSGTKKPLSHHEDVIGAEIEKAR